MIDFHCHLDLYPDPMKVFAEVKRRKVEVLAVTTSPRAYIKTSQHFRGSDNVRVALGFHPELVKQRHFEKDLFFEQMKSVCFLGEIGIDGSRRAMESLSEQIAFFNEVIHKASINNRKVLSLHSRGAVKEVLQTLESNNGNYVPVLHWFTGKIKEAEKAIELGCWFSINPKMCFTETGKKIIKCLPLDRILPETDAPFVQINGAPYMPWDTTVTSYLARENRLEFDYLNSLLHKNLDHIINLVQNN